MHPLIRGMMTRNMAARGILIVGHGTRSLQGQAEARQLSELLSTRLAPAPVELGFLELSSPTIGEAIHCLIQRGVNHLVVSPLLLFAAGHALRDIPGSLKVALAQWPELRLSMAGALDCHPAVVALSRQRGDEALAKMKGSASKRALVMVGRGSREVEATAAMRRFSALRCQNQNWAVCHTCFYDMAEPRLADILPDLAQDFTSQGVGQVLVQPHLLFEGQLLQSVDEIVEQTASTERLMQWRVAPRLGVSSLLVDAICSRIDQARPVDSEA